jgi:hypothetical protein
MKSSLRCAVVSIAFSALALGGCASADGTEGSPEPEKVGQSSDAIQGGAPDTDHPEVGIVYSADDSFCSGTLIAPTVVLTAGHCVGNVEGFYLGAGAAGQTWPDLSQFTRYGAEPAGVSYSNDIALVHLTSPVAGVTPFGTYGDKGAVGQSCTMIGFGGHNEGATEYVGERRTATSKVSKITSTYVVVKWVDGIADHGDSGGPLICNGAIVGTTHNHTDGDYPDHVVENYGRITSSIAKKISAQVAAWSN